MQILVVSATKLEIAPFLLQNELEAQYDFLITGVGVPACLYQLQKKLLQKKYDFVIQAGIAGSFTTEIPLGETVVVQKDIFADMGAIEKNQFTTLFEMGLISKNEFPYHEGWLENNAEFFIKTTLKSVNAITVNTVSDKLETTGLYTKLFNAQIESMEGAALHYVCLQENVKFLQLRSISNEVGERNKAHWKMKEAILHLNNTLSDIIKQITAG